MPASSLALLLATSAPTLYLQVDVGAGSPCRVEALAGAIRVQRPDAPIAFGPRPGPADLEAELSESAGTFTLTVRGAGNPLTRVLPPPADTCEETLQTAALMIDRYVDELRASAEEAEIGELDPPPPRRFSLFLGSSLVQASAGLSFGLTLEADLRLGLLLTSLGGEVNRAQKKAVVSFEGAYQMTPAAAWLAAGVAPRLGPGHFLVQASFGLSLLWVDVQSSLSPPLPHQQSGNAVDPFVGLRAGYVLDLPARFSLALRFEERFVPAPTTFFVEGYSGTVSIRSFSGDLALMAGYSFF